MKMVVVITVEEYSLKIKEIFAEHQIPFYSESEIKNFRMSNPDESDNWFGHTNQTISGHIIFTFLPEAAARELMNGIKSGCKENDMECPVSVFILNVDQYYMNTNE